MRKTRFISLVCLCLTFQLVRAQQKPNVIIILTDDQGSIDLNSYGSKDLYTPNIDELASKGVKFTQFYAAAPLCSPSRASMLTGLNPHAAGLPGNASSMRGTRGMPTEKFTIAEAMKEVGYTTGHIGKWHLGFTPETMPNGQGFDYSFGHMGGCIDNYSHFFYWNGPNRHDLFENGQEVWEDGHYFPDLMTEKADEFIAQNQDTPFFLYYAINLPHYPLQPTAKWREYYADLSKPRKDYAAFVSTIDERVGHLMNTLDSLNLRENTIIVFQSDHGHSVEDRAFRGGGNSGPYRGAKMSLFEGGIRVPAIISYPKQIPVNEERNQVALNIDWFPTIMDYVGEESKNLEGKSLRPLIENPSIETEHQVFRWKQGVSWAVRKGDWKLIGFPQDPTKKAVLDPENDVLFLSNLAEDVREVENLASQYPEKVKELLGEYMKWEFASTEDIPKEREWLASIARSAELSLAEKPSNKYPAQGAKSLHDEKLGSRQFNDGFWMGFEEDNLTATIDLGEVQQIERVVIGTLQDAASWIFFPEYVEVSWSVDGKNYSQPKRIEVGALKDAGRKLIKRISVEQENVHSRFIKVLVKNTGKCPTWHMGAGQKAWLFVDEITVQ
ncbi:sulfatase [Roseivirga sp. E12]|uniref:sulfatase family protein n=1 Tax=Roseivirga sp. E12 TaxID=2819237 RepID=UPI001ABC297C|nr:sulfatase-like hydrolase/transferase [Roseivirga sp. E12]MBO3699919.1 sulfatase-like hydrolase/transferase [Roseivirga sp. E12]